MSNKNSNWPNAAQPDATPAEIGELVQTLDELRKLPPVSKNSPEQVKERLDYYFRYCGEYGVRCSVEGMVLALGRSRQCLWEWENDPKSKSGELIRRAKDLINAMLTAWTMNGKINAVYSIWLQKNHFSYSDNKVLEIRQAQPEHATMSDLEEQLEAAGLVWNEKKGEFVPIIDADIREV